MGIRPPVNDVFDYIVIGAGTAGGVIAKKLTDDFRTSVLVLEAGTNMANLSPSIETAGFLANDNKLSFMVFSNPEEMIGRQLRAWGGRVIGGSSQHNFMTSVRGSRGLYDQWATLVGRQWSYENIRSLFIQNETYTGLSQNPDERGINGPIYVRQQSTPPSGIINTLTVATSEALGIPIVEDYNTGIVDCTFTKTQLIQQAVEGGFVRSSTATGYLNRQIVTQGDEFHSDEFGVGGRKLVIYAKTTVNKIIFKKKAGANIAVGVDFVRDGDSQKAYARKGIIVSAGIFSSVVLQRSGIGRRSELEAAGIQTIVDSPHVGHNFLTHYFVPMGIEVETSRLLQVLSVEPNLPALLGAFKSYQEPGRRLQLIGLPTSFFIPIQEVMIRNWQFNPNNPSNIMSIAISDLNPKSKGTIRAAHSDPEAYPTIEFHPLQNPDDLAYIIDRYIETFNIIERARELDPSGIYRVVFPQEEIFLIDDEEEKREQLASFVRATYLNYAHFGGNCRMGRTIQDGVVDGFLNVFGTKNLKVADLSIAPILPDGNTSNPAQMIGLNAVRFIRNGL
ncbi:MAG TPA: GMC family oxidoreductase [Candidatus Bathyarchaeia archaeon]|nr:GMC family oxidoreductase [Candidatus Bathyarchaeia archaeon]